MLSILKTFLLALTPIGELRAAIPVALTVFGMNWLLAYIVAVIGNLVPVVFLLLFLEPVAAWFSKKFKICNKFFDWLFKRTRKKSETKMTKYGYLGLILFVAIPLPVTGAWTGSLVAFLFKIPFKKAFPLIAAGVAIAGVIVTIITKAGIGIEKCYGWQVLIAVLAIVIIGLLLFKRFKKLR